MANTGTTAVRPFGMRDKLGYMFGDFGNDFTFMLSSSFMMVFYTDIMGVPAAIVGLLMMVARFVDAFTDVAMGQIVDRAKPTKDGRFRPWIKRMCGPVAIAFVPDLSVRVRRYAHGLQGGVDVRHLPAVGFHFLHLHQHPLRLDGFRHFARGQRPHQLSTSPQHRRHPGPTWSSAPPPPLLAYETVNGTPVLSGSRMLVMAGLFSVCRHRLLSAVLQPDH